MQQRIRAITSRQSNMPELEGRFGISTISVVFYQRITPRSHPLLLGSFQERTSRRLYRLASG